jgi:hypothetical protein
VDQHDLLSPVPIALDVHGAGSGWNPKNVGVDGGSLTEGDTIADCGLRANLGSERPFRNPQSAINRLSITPLDPLLSAL